MSYDRPANKVRARSKTESPSASYDAGKRPRGWPHTLDYSVFDPLDVEPMALVRAVLRPPKGKRAESNLRASLSDPW